MSTKPDQAQLARFESELVFDSSSNLGYFILGISSPERDAARALVGFKLLRNGAIQIECAATVKEWMSSVFETCWSIVETVEVAPSNKYVKAAETESRGQARGFWTGLLAGVLSVAVAAGAVYAWRKTDNLRKPRG